MLRPRSRTGALAVVLSSYVLATIAAWATVNALADWHVLARVAVADVVATAVVFVFSRIYDNSSFYDPYWSVAPMLIAVHLAFGPYATEGISVRKWLAILVVWIWGARLTFNWIRGWAGLEQEDWRYVQFRPQWGKAYWPLSFLGIHLFPTVCTYLGCLPLFSAMRSDRPIGLLDLAGVGISLAGAIIEGVADEQLRTHRHAAKGAICDVGLWRYSRHPNYFGECLFWLGLFVLGAAAEPGHAWYAASGIVVIVGLFLFYSIPAAERRSLARRAAYGEHQKRVSAFIPWFRTR